MNAMRVRKRKPPLGQHFLVSEPIINRIVDAIGPKMDDTMVEIGPGHGALTERLAEKVGKLHAIELDPRLAGQLQENLSGSNVTIHCHDALLFNYASVFGDAGKIRLVGNLPYAISTELILSFRNKLGLVEDFCFMVQKEVAQRLTATSGSKRYGRLTVSVSRHMYCEVLFDVAPDAFSPPPDVQSSVIHMRPTRIAWTDPDHSDRFDELVRIAFSKRRKTLRNSLAGKLTDESFERVNIDGGLRAEDLTVEQFEQLAHQFRNQS